eukprot:TRINITY_DN13492_c0_g2_i3.p1 TRINITY_DN13492_c0_g2~~TRINITY_DN13492_c0_g2_i3.p1  ORF type:complete len:210 (+),score=30.92 TRINITY_DN13492_c0_g2_i3:62-691(+)
MCIRDRHSLESLNLSKLNLDDEFLRKFRLILSQMNEEKGKSQSNSSSSQSTSEANNDSSRLVYLTHLHFLDITENPEISGLGLKFLYTSLVDEKRKKSLLPDTEVKCTKKSRIGKAILMDEGVYKYVKATWLKHRTFGGTIIKWVICPIVFFPFTIVHAIFTLIESGIDVSKTIIDSAKPDQIAVSYTHLRAHETPEHLVCRLLLEKKN